MEYQSIADLLPLVEKPSQYLGNEINAVKKDADIIKLHIALAFPDLYEIGMSHFGLQILYHILNSHQQIAAERVYAPGSDVAAHLKSEKISLSSLETGTPLSRFDIIGCSLLYELNYTNVLMMLDLAGIPFYSSQRDSSHPIIIAGGPCTVNPEPMADFFDAMVVGDGETVIMDLAQSFMLWKAGDDRDKDSLLSQWAKIDGVYIPSFFQPIYDGPDFHHIQPKHPEYTHVNRAIVADLDKTAFPSSPVIPYGRPVHDRLRIEIARGCTRGCRFCQAGMIYRPVRERSVENLLSLVETSIATTGYEDVSLLSLSTGDYSCLSSLMHQLISLYAAENIAVSLPSVRAGTLTPELMKLIKQVRKTGFTIAPEAGSERLRAVINKNISEKEIFETIANAFELGWGLIKLYFMIGLPTETDYDVRAIVDLVRRVKKKIKTGGRRSNINVSVGTFIPKSHIPFQWAPQLSLEESQEKIFSLRRQLKMPGVNFKWQKPEVSLIEGLWARGDRRLSPLLEIAYHKGCCFDGWSDKFNFRLWEEALEDAGIDINYYTIRQRELDEPLPWDHIHTGVSKEFLQSEFKNALSEKSTLDCRQGDCQGCGVCDFEKIMPLSFNSNNNVVAVLSDTKTAQPKTQTGSNENRVEISYAKRGMAKYFGHLELVNIFIRALRRAGLPVKFSQGFHPKPKMSFHDPLPVGMESEKNLFCLTLKKAIDKQKVISILNMQLPEGLSILDCRTVAAKSIPLLDKTALYMISISEDEYTHQKLKEFNDAPKWIFHWTTRKGRKKQVDLKEIVLNMKRLSSTKLKLHLNVIPEMRVRPGDVIASIFNFSKDVICRAEIVKEKLTDEPFV